MKLWKTVQQWSMKVGLVLPDLNAKDSMLGFFTTKGTLILENHVLLILKIFFVSKQAKSECCIPFSFQILLETDL